MKYKEFVGQVQNRLELAELGEAVRATRAVLTTLGERLQEGEANDLAGSLPMEIDRYLTEAESGQRFDFAEFVDRVAEREGIERSDAQYHASASSSSSRRPSPAANWRTSGASFPRSSTRCSR